MTRQNQESPQAHGAHAKLRQRAEAVGRELAESLRGLLTSLPSPSWRAEELAERLGQSVVTSGRLLRGIGHADPLTVLLQVPGPQPLRRVIRAAEQNGASATTAEAAHAAVDGFRDLIRDHIGGRRALSSILALWVPEAAREFEMRRRQSLFRAVSELHGAQQDLELISAVLTPSGEGVPVDLAIVLGSLGVMRLRPGVQVDVTASELDSEAGDHIVDMRHPNAGGPFGPGGLNHYCSNPVARLEAKRLGEQVRYTLADDVFGPKAKVDHLLAHFVPHDHPRAVGRRSSTGEASAPFLLNIQDFPKHKLIMDCFVHRDLLCERTPRLELYTVAGRAPINPHRPESVLDSIQTHERVHVMGEGLQHASIGEFPQYVPMLTEVFAHLGRDPDEYRLARISMAYPPFGSQVTLVHPVRGDDGS